MSVLVNPYAVAPAAVLWTPTNLGAAVKGWWAAEDLANGAVTSWAPRTGSLTLTQATGGAQPVRSATSAGGFPGVTFDGVDDYMDAAATTGLVTGTTSGELWAVAQLVTPIATASIVLFAYGSNTANSARRLTRVSDGRARIDDITVVANSANLAWDLGVGAALDGASTGLNICGGKFTTAGHTVRFNGTAVTGAAAASMNTLTTRTRLGAATGTTAAGFWEGPVAEFMVTTELSGTDQSKLDGWAAHKYLLTAKLPGGHPYKSSPPTV